MKMLGWKALHLKEVYRSRPVFSLLYTGKGNWEELVDRYQHDPACTIQTDIAGIYSDLEERIHGSGSKTCILRELYTDDSWPLVKLKGLEAQKEPCIVTLYSDSKYLIDAINKKWIESWQKNGWKNSQKKPVKKRELFERLIELMQIHTVEFSWVKGHDGHEENERCDTLATTAANGENLSIDKDYIK